MEEEPNVRLVRCPKCENLLPELPGFSVYQCGGCGAVLRAEKKGPVGDRLSDKSDGEMGRGGVENGHGGILESPSKSTSDDGLEHGRKKEQFPEKSVNLVSSSSSITENRKFVNSFVQINKKEAMNLRVDHINQDGDGGYCSDRYMKYSKCSTSNGVHEQDDEVNTKMKKSESGNPCVKKVVEENKPPIGNFAGSMRTRPIMDHRSVERNGPGAFYGNGSGSVERRRFSTLPYPDEGPSSYRHGSFHGYTEQKRGHHVLDGPGGVEHLENDRAELIRKLDELKDQLSRSCDVTEKQRVKPPVSRTTPPPPPPPPPPPNQYYRHDFHVPQGPSNFFSANVEPFAPGHVQEPLYCSHSCGPVPYTNGRAYPPHRDEPNEFAGYEQSYLPQRLRQPPHQLQPQYFKQPFHDHFPGRNMDFNLSSLVSHQNETFSRMPACSCSQCCKNFQVPTKVPCPTVRSLADPINPSFQRLVSSAAYGVQGYNGRGTNPPQARSSTAFDVDTDGLGLRRPRRVVVANGSEQVCYPIRGGAPFMTCCSCFELLKLPRKPIVTRKNQQKVRCGACSAIILIELEKKGIVVSVPTQLKKVFPEGGATDSCSDDYGNSGYDFHLTDSEPNGFLTEQMLNFDDSNERQDPLSSTSSFSQDERSPDSMISQREISDSADTPAKDDVPIPLPDSHQKDPDKAASNFVVSRCGIGNKSKRNDQEKLILDKSTARQNSVKDVSIATEMEVSFNGFPNGSDSVEVSEEDRPKIKKGSESFFAGLIKKGFKEFSRSSQSMETGRINVFVNGHPIPDRVVKKAEKLAGPIQPGSYWYDYRAGFWGVMGQPCSGIIPPVIEEFDYPMPEDCAAGNTGVYVNGRELNQKDMDLLAGRGLPTAGDKSYIIEISGRILDEDTGEELDSLGKLAPTVEKAKHGFGMKAPRTLAE